MAEARGRGALRKLVSERAHGRCEYCMSPDSYSPAHFSLEHITPQALGGETDPENLAWCCQGRNNVKYTKTHASDPVTLEEVRLFNPRLDRWGDHFQWEEDFTRVVGVSAIGRATVEALDLNRFNLVNLRQALNSHKAHPAQS